MPPDICFMSYNASSGIDLPVSTLYRGSKKSQSWFFYQEIIAQHRSTSSSTNSTTNWEFCTPSFLAYASQQGTCIGSEVTHFVFESKSRLLKSFRGGSSKWERDVGRGGESVGKMVGSWLTIFVQSLQPEGNNRHSRAFSRHQQGMIDLSTGKHFLIHSLTTDWWWEHVHCPYSTKTREVLYPYSAEWR